MLVINNILSLNGNDWQLTGWYRNQWRPRVSMELGMAFIPNITPIKAKVPGTIQCDLIEADLLQDPNIGLNSLDGEWVNNREWIVEKQFTVSNDWLKDRCEIVFEGLDYDGEIHLNGTKLIQFEGMFKPIKLDVTALIKTGKEETNQLQVVFYQTPELDGQIGYSDRIQKLKSRYNYVWDWCPRIVPVGIWKSVYLKTFHDLSFVDFYPNAKVADNLTSGEIHLKSEVDVLRKGNYTIEYHVYNPDGVKSITETFVETLGGGRRKLEHLLNLDKVELWWPNGYGEQPIYNIEITVYDLNGKICDHSSKQIGFRKMEFIQNEGVTEEENTLPYTLLVNNQRIFMKGINWVPISPFYGSVTAEQYQNYLGRFKAMNVNLVRVWGGAIIEREEFYDYCNKNGLLVWQEFLQSSSGINNTPPDDPQFLQELEEISRIAVVQKRNHPSLIIWCGGNELMWEGSIPVDERHVNIKMLKNVVKELDPDRYFLPTSPSGPSFTFTYENAGKGKHHDVHGPWVYLGDKEHYKHYNLDDGLFRTETGTPSTSRAETLRNYSGKFNAWPPTKDNIYWLHRGSWWLQWEQLAGMFGSWDEKKDELESYCQASQYVQMESLRYAVEATRRREPESSGFIVWMGNEPFPNNANTSVIEYDGMPKPAYYALKRAFSSRHISASYHQLAYQQGEQFTSDIFVHDEHLSMNELLINARILDTHGNVIKEQNFMHEASSINQLEWEVAECPNNIFIVDLKVVDGDEVVAENNYIFTVNAERPLEPLRRIPEVSISIDHGHSSNELILKNESDVVAIGVTVREKDANKFLEFDRNYLVLLPNETVSIQCVNKAITPDDVVLEAFNIHQ